MRRNNKTTLGVRVCLSLLFLSNLLVSFWRKGRSELRVLLCKYFRDCEQKEFPRVSRTIVHLFFINADTQRDLCSTPRIPFSEAKVTRCSVFAVICRLKSYTYSTHGQRKQDFTCRVPEYPDVTVTIPASVIQKNGDFQLTLKV